MQTAFLTALFLTAFITALAASLAAQDVGECRATIVASVRDKRGRLLTDLQPSSFHATVGHSPAKILSAQVRTSPPPIVLLLDQSGSVNHLAFKAATTVAGSFVTSVAGKARIAVVFFSNHVIDTTGFDSPTADVFRKLSDLRGGEGRTAIYDSLIYGAGLFSAPTPGEAVYVITDGGDNCSKSDPREVEREFLSRGVRLFAFVWSDPPSFADTEKNGQTNLLHLADVTGGSAIFLGASEAVGQGRRFKTAVQSLYDVMVPFYELEVQTRPTGMLSPLRLEVVDVNGQKRRGIDVIYPKKLASCAPGLN